MIIILLLAVLGSLFAVNLGTVAYQNWYENHHDPRKLSEARFQRRRAWTVGLGAAYLHLLLSFCAVTFFVGGVNLALPIVLAWVGLLLFGVGLYLRVITLAMDQKRMASGQRRKRHDHLYTPRDITHLEAERLYRVGDDGELEPLTTDGEQSQAENR